MRAPLLFLIAAACALAPAAAQGEDADNPVLTELRLVSGDVVAGALVSQDDEKVVLRRIFKNKGREMSVHMTYPRKNIASMVEKKPIDEYKKRLKEMPATANANYDLAYWCVNNHLDELGFEHARDALALDKDHVKARELLLTSGLVEHEGLWYTEEQLKGRDLVKIGDQVMTTMEAEEFRRSNAKLFVRNDLRNKLDACRDSITRTTAEFNKSSVRLKTVESDAAVAQQTADAAAAKLATTESMEANAESSLKELQNTTSAPDSSPADAANKANQLTAAQKQLRTAKEQREQAQKEAEAAKRELAPFKLEVIRLKASVPALELKLAKATADERELAGKLSRAETELADEEAARKAATPAPPPSASP
jgi:hypothetical protein